MARRKELLNIATGLVGSFNSRNNDDEGYWAIGRLKSCAMAESINTLTFDLLTGQVTVYGKISRSILSAYKEKLSTHLTTHGIPITWLRHVEIHVSFSQVALPSYEVLRSALGDLYQCRCIIIDDLNHEYSVSTYGHCLPHNPAKEFRSTGR